jgi:hypothetical protein
MMRVFFTLIVRCYFRMLLGATVLFPVIIVQDRVSLKVEKDVTLHDDKIHYFTVHPL